MGSRTSAYACGATSISEHCVRSLIGRLSPSCPITGAAVATSTRVCFFAPSAGPLCLPATARISAARTLCTHICRFYFRFIGLGDAMRLRLSYDMAKRFAIVVTLSKHQCHEQDTRYAPGHARVMALKEQALAAWPNRVAAAIGECRQLRRGRARMCGLKRIKANSYSSGSPSEI